MFPFQNTLGTDYFTFDLFKAKIVLKDLLCTSAISWMHKRLILTFGNSVPKIKRFLKGFLGLKFYFIHKLGSNSPFLTIGYFMNVKGIYQ